MKVSHYLMVIRSEGVKHQGRIQGVVEGPASFEDAKRVKKG